MANYKTKKEKRVRRHKRLRKKVFGTAERPRLCVSFTQKHIYIQCIDDDKALTLAFVSSLNKEFRKENSSDTDGAAKLGKQIAEEILKDGIKDIVFDRSGYRYHGRVKAIAEAARKAGLKF